LGITAEGESARRKKKPAWGGGLLRGGASKRLGVGFELNFGGTELGRAEKHTVCFLLPDEKTQ